MTPGQLRQHAAQMPSTVQGAIKLWAALAAKALRDAADEIERLLKRGA